ncbi:hypothetical protein LZC95_25240 [Pendulispora brunnea]|uniref:Uncharacterized protein n=1 Tax=Pendulispora brunnea TaxID=2905690 RepID=A0ABZ2KR98_9BACT
MRERRERGKRARLPWRALWTGPAVGLLLILVGIAHAASGQSDRARAESVIAELEGNAANKALTADVVRRARQYLEQGQKMRAEGDEAHAKLADSVAREWAEVGRDLVRTVELEKRAIEARRAADDAGAEVERERALLDEGIAQNGRLRAQVEAAEREKKQEPDKTSPSATRDAGAPKAAPRGTQAPAKGRQP